MGPVFLLLACFVRVAWRLGAGALGDALASPGDRAARREARLTAAARDVAAVLGALKGPFVKAGQFAALRVDLLPAAARRAFETLHDRVEPLPLATVRAVVEEDLGAPLDRLFGRFDPAPLGTASIAQVHHAVLPGGEEVAVKVQHPWLEQALPRDLALLRALLGVWLLASGRRSRSGVDRVRLFEEFAAGLAEELDFVREGEHAEEIAENLAREAQIVVPRIFATHSRRRVLTMSYHPAIPILDRDALARRGVEPRAVLEVLARAYARQVFVDGLFHADPHPGNLFVIDEPECASRPRVLFVDFGLSKRLDPVLRRELRLGIYALLQRDLDGFLAGMGRMGMIAPGAEGAVRASVSAMFERMRAQGGAPLGLSGSQVLGLKDEAKALLYETPGLQLPNDLLLYAKTISYLFALGHQLDPGVDLVKLVVPFLLQFLAQRDPSG